MVFTEDLGAPPAGDTWLQAGAASCCSRV